MKEKILKPEIIAVLAIALVAVSLLMVKPIVGVADNGDFGRVMTPVGLQSAAGDDSERFFGYIQSAYGVKHIGLWGGGDYFTTHIIPLKVAIVINNIICHNGFFNIRFLSLVYSLIFIFSIFLMIKYNHQRFNIVNWMLAALMVIIFADVGYLSYFNSLYGEAASYVFLLLMVGAAVYLIKQETPTIGALVFYFVASLLFVGAKQQNCPLIIFVGALGIRFWKLRKDRFWKSVIVGCMILLVASSAVVYSVISLEIRNVNIHQAVFLGILKDSPSVQDDLEALGLSRDLAVLAGKTYFDKDAAIKPEDPFMKKEFFDKISYKKILGFYITHPVRFIQKMDVTAHNAFTIRQDYLGNYEKSSNAVYGQHTNRFGVWSYLKKTITPNNLIFVIIFYIAFYGFWFTEYRKTTGLAQKLYYELFLVIGAIGVVQFVMPVLADGEGDLSKHLFLFNVCFDMMLVTAVTWITTTAIHRRERLKSLYGVTQ